MESYTESEKQNLYFEATAFDVERSWKISDIVLLLIALLK